MTNLDEIDWRRVFRALELRVTTGSDAVILASMGVTCALIGLSRWTSSLLDWADLASGAFCFVYATVAYMRGRRNRRERLACAELIERVRTRGLS